jgi:hypothetical protein
VFTARYALSPYIKQIRFVFKELKLSTERFLNPYSRNYNSNEMNEIILVLKLRSKVATVLGWRPRSRGTVDPQLLGSLHTGHSHRRLVRQRQTVCGRHCGFLHGRLHCLASPFLSCPSKTECTTTQFCLRFQTSDSLPARLKTEYSIHNSVFIYFAYVPFCRTLLAKNTSTRPKNRMPGWRCVERCKTCTILLKWTKEMGWVSTAEILIYWKINTLTLHT